MRLASACLVIVYSLLLQSLAMPTEGQPMGSHDAGQFAQEKDKRPLDEDKPGGVRGDSMNQEDIQRIQQRLRAAGFDPGTTEEYLGPQTRKAIRDYQNTHGLRQTGTLNKETYNLLMGSSPH